MVVHKVQRGLSICGAAGLICAFISVPRLIQPSPVHAIDNARAAWLRAQGAFETSLTQTPSFGESVSQEGKHWRDLTSAFTAYMSTSQPWKMSRGALQAALGRTSSVMGYAVQEWQTSVGRLRLVTFSDGGKAYDDGNASAPNICFTSGSSPMYAGQVLVWDAGSGMHAQLMWTMKNATVSRAVIIGGAYIQGLRAWHSQHGGMRLAVIEQTACGASGWWVQGSGAALPATSDRWVGDPSMFPSNVVAGVDANKPTIAFTDQRGMTVSVMSPIFNKAIGESNAAEHVYARRLLTRGSDDRYHPQPWHLVPGPYLTLVEAVGAAKTAQQGGIVDGCTSTTVQPWVASPAVGTRFCALDWSKGAAWMDTTPDDGAPNYKRIPITYTLSLGAIVGQHQVAVTVMPVGRTWLISRIQGKAG